MRHLIIRNFGPISEIDINLKRVNVIIGPQSSGKSTVLKVACFCDWMERQIEISQDPDYYCNPTFFVKNLVTFHKLEGFMQENTYISYANDALSFEYDAQKGNCKFSWGRGNRRWNYKRTKIAYIPSERNLVAAIPNWYQVSMENNNILDFMKEWEFARKTFKNKENIIGLPFAYKYNTTNKTDNIIMPNGQELNLTNASSGLQSLTPLYIMIKYLTGGFYKEKHIKVEDSMLRDSLEQIVTKECGAMTKEKQQKIVDNIMTPYRTDMYIEEPEAHIFPSTQKDFVYSLVSLLNGKTKHSCVIATHSPYIMTSFNNLIQAGQIAKESDEKTQKVKERFTTRQLLRYDDVAAFSMHDGQATSILDKEYGLISADALDAASQDISDDFNFLINI